MGLRNIIWPAGKRFGRGTILLAGILFTLSVTGCLLLVALFGVTRAASLPHVPAAQEQQTPVAAGPITPGVPECNTSPSSAGPLLSPTPQDVAVNPTGTVAPSAFGFAWFHKPPSDGTTPAQLAANSRYIHLTGPSDAAFRDAVKRAGFTGPIYTYTVVSAAEGPGPYYGPTSTCDAGYHPYDNNLAWGVDDFCKYLNPNESWFLHNGAGQRLIDDYFGTGRYSYLMNPADPGWRAFVQDRLGIIRAQWGYDGVWLDNVDLDLNRAQTELKNSDGKVREFSSDDEWRAAMSGLLAGVRQQLGTLPIWANLVGGGLGAGSWDAYAPYLDGAMDESFSVKWLQGWRSNDDWESQMERAERWLAAGKSLVAVGQGATDDTNRMMFTLASYLLVAQDRRASFRYTRFDSYYSSMWLFPQYEDAKKLGMPTGPRQEVRPGVWQRDYTNGSVRVDLNAQRGILSLR